MCGRRWEYCLLSCTPLSGLDDDGYRVLCHVTVGGTARDVEVRTSERSPMAAMGQLLNQLGEEGWELVTFDTSTHRGVLKRLAAESGDT
jgi:hypothetical protein